MPTLAGLHGSASAPALPLLGGRTSSTSAATRTFQPEDDSGVDSGLGTSAASKPARKPRRKKPPMLNGVGDDNADDTIPEVGTPTMKAKRSGSMVAVVSWMRKSMSGGGTPGGRRSSQVGKRNSVSYGSRISMRDAYVNEHRVVTARSPTAHRSIPLAQAPTEFEHMGDFVRHHREGRDRLAREGFDPDDDASTVSATRLPPVQSALVDDDVSHWDPEGALRELRNAARTNDFDRIRRLLSVAEQEPRGLSLDKEDDAGDTAALIAARMGNAAACAALLDGGADPLARDRHPNYFGDGVWPDEANRKEDAHGKAVAPKENAQTGRTVVYHLRQNKCFDECIARTFPMTRFSIVRACAGYLQEFYHKTALIVAATHGNADLAAVLLLHSAAMVGLPPVEGMTPGMGDKGQALLAACSGRKFRVAEVLLAGGVPRAAIDGTRDARGRTALHIAVHLGEIPLVRLLLQSSASTAVYNKAGRQPLHDACFNGHDAIARILAEHGADLYAVTHEGLGPPGSAFRSGGAGRTPHEIASGRGHDALATYLRERTIGARTVELWQKK